MTEPAGASNWQVPAYDTHVFGPKRHPYCLCIPVINEGDRIRRQLERTAAAGVPELADVLILDGGSTDGSLDHSLLRANGVSALLVKTGPGKLSAQLRMGYAFALQAGYQGIVTIDGNGKDGVEAIAEMVRCLEQGWDFVQGSRYLPGAQAINTPLVRGLASRLIHVPLLSLAAGFRYTDTTNGFRAYSSRLLLDERVQPFRDVFDTYELLAYLTVRAPRLGFRTSEIPVVRAYPASGKTPTKISAFSGNMLLMRILLRAVLGAYNPAPQRQPAGRS